MKILGRFLFECICLLTVLLLECTAEAAHALKYPRARDALYGKANKLWRAIFEV